MRMSRVAYEKDVAYRYMSADDPRRYQLASEKSRRWLKRACAAFLFALGEGWDVARKQLNLRESDELWLERFRS